MRVESLVRPGDKLLIKTLLAHTRLVARYQQNRFARGIEREGDSPNAVSGVEAQLLHVGMTRTIQGINAGPSQLWPKLLQQACMSQNLQPDLLGQVVEFRLELVPNFYGPFH